VHSGSTTDAELYRPESSRKQISAVCVRTESTWNSEGEVFQSERILSFILETWHKLGVDYASDMMFMAEPHRLLMRYTLLGGVAGAVEVGAGRKICAMPTDLYPHLEAVESDRGIGFQPRGR
jgi:hypothetical protein